MTHQTPIRIGLGLLASLFLLAACATPPTAGGNDAQSPSTAGFDN